MTKLTIKDSGSRVHIQTKQEAFGVWFMSQDPFHREHGLPPWADETKRVLVEVDAE